MTIERLSKALKRHGNTLREGRRGYALTEKEPKQAIAEGDAERRAGAGLVGEIHMNESCFGLFMGVVPFVTGSVGRVSEGLET